MILDGYYASVNWALLSKRRGGLSQANRFLARRVDCPPLLFDKDLKVIPHPKIKLPSRQGMGNIRELGPIEVEGDAKEVHC
jgi:hypothetical protein